MTPEVIVHHPVPPELQAILDALGYVVVEVAETASRYTRSSGPKLGSSESRDSNHRAEKQAGRSPKIGKEQHDLPVAAESSVRRRKEASSNDDLTHPSLAPSPAARFVSIDLAAHLLGIGRTTVYDLVNRGELRSTKVGRRTLLAVEDIDAFVDRKLASA